MSDNVAWNSFVAESKNGTLLFDRGYMEYHRDKFTDASLLITDESGRPVAIFPANQEGDCVVSHRGLSYGGIISNSQMTTTKMIDVFAELRRHLVSEGIKTLHYKTVPTIYHRMPAEEDRYALFLHGATLSRRDVLSVVELSAAGPVQERRVRGARKAEQAGVIIEESEEYGEFWPILSANLLESHDRRPVHSLEEIELLRGRFSASIRLFVAKRAGEIVGGTVLYIAGHTAHAQYIGSTVEGRRLGALDLLFSSLVKRFHQLRYFDFGISNEGDGRDLNRGLIAFKEGFGARAIVHDHYSLTIS